MSRNLSHKGKGQDTEPVALPVSDDQSKDSSPTAKKPSSRPSLSTPLQRRANQAMGDAQTSLDSLLKSPSESAGSAGPQIISPSGRIRNETKGRIAGPSAPLLPGKAAKAPRPPYILSNGPDDEDIGDALAVVPGPAPLYGAEGETHDVPATALGRGVALATGRLQTARDRAGLLVRSDTAQSLGLAPDAEALHTSRRAASQWATRYATHLVVLLVVGVLVSLGGLKALTTQGAYSHDLQSAAALGTDHFDDGDAEYAQPGQQPIDSADYNITLPRTELGGADASRNSVVKPPVAAAGDPQQPQQPSQTGPQAPGSIPAGKVTKYTVVQGDTVETVAHKFDVMLETVMGSNGIYDSEEILDAGRVLMIPPIDGMYYVAQRGDTLQSVAERFQVEPDVVTAYAGNKLQNGQIVPGQPLVVPSGMMPAREQTVTYTVRGGDTLKRIAARYGIDVPTILYSNDVPRPDSLTVGMQLRLLPLPGMEYKVAKGDTVLSIADKLNVAPQMILDYPPNNLTADTALQVDQTIMVPGGSPEHVVAEARVEPVSRGASKPPERPEPRVDPPKIDPQPDGNSNSSDSGSTSSGDNSGRQDTSGSEPAPTPKPRPTAKPTSAPKPTAKPTAKPATSTNASANSYKSGTGNMIWPVNGTITQYFSSRHNGLDIAISAGTPIHAADSGKVVWAGWRTDGLGYCVMIDHMDGYSTVYGHMIRQPAVYVGQYVSRGQVIGYIGSTGHSTGPHVHFMVKGGSAASHNYRNPLAFLGR